mgnify:CR=1 FL=1
MAGLENQILHGPLDNLEVRGGVNRSLHGLAIELAIRLGPRAMHGRPLGAVEQPELDASRICDSPHQAIERIDLPDQVTLTQPADCRVAGHLSDGGELVRDQRRARPHPRSGRRRLATRMATPDDDDVVVVRRLQGDGHGDTRSDQDWRERYWNPRPPSKRQPRL